MKKLILITTILLACGLSEGDPDTEIPQSGESSSESTGALESDASSSEESTDDGSSDDTSSESGSTSTSSETSSTSSGETTVNDVTTGECVGFRPRYDACGEACGSLCQDGLICRHAGDLAECTQECETDDECGAGTCSGGFCILFLCATDADCPGGMECYPGDGESDPEHPVAHCIPLAAA